MTKKEVNLAIINGLKAKEINIAEIELNHLEAFADIMYKAITVTHCCTELPDQMVIKSPEGKILMLNCNDLLRMELKEKVIEGFETWTVVGTGAVIQ
jgi:hypothetical protein